MSALNTAFVQCANLAIRDTPKVSGRPEDKVAKLSELRLLDLQQGSAILAFDADKPHDALFTDQNLDRMWFIFKDLAAGARDGTLIEKAARYSAKGRVHKIAKPFYDLLPSLEDDSKVRLVFEDETEYVFTKEHRRQIGEIPKDELDLANQFRAITTGICIEKRDGGIDLVDLENFDLIEVTEGEKIQTDEETHIGKLNWTYLEYSGIRLSFKGDLLVNIHRGPDYYAVTSPGQYIEGIGHTKEEALNAFKDLFITAYKRYSAMKQDKMAGRASEIARFLVDIVAEEKEN
ncbi:hypothetical protein IIA79_05420 [bacterium]|nr:hypothetical protein [bacterium]